jgi:putative ABC transport system ATP-binding protein|tara:strand:+ start:2018 stop:2692 length:675 start_codon:yes stop_codon:yes gene_type:complete
MKMEIVSLDDVWKIYVMDQVEVPAVRGISLSVNKGDFLSIMGPSGCGKSTLMNLIGCLDRPTKGKVYIKGKDISKLSDNKLALIRRDQIGFVFQQFNLISRLSALENVVLPMWFAGLEKNKRIKRATNLLKKVGLEKRITHKPTELSGGERQRVSIARAIANNPEVILADEPTGNLDSKSGKEIIDLLETLNNDGKTIIIVTHELEFARRAEKMIKLKDGLIEK